jgi:hypothetical protein
MANDFIIRNGFISRDDSTVLGSLSAITYFSGSTDLTNIINNIASQYSGVTSINNLTGSIQTLVTGSTGTDFNISSSTDTHTFNLPTASATNTGKLSNTDWNKFANSSNLFNYYNFI